MMVVALFLLTRCFFSLTYVIKKRINVKNHTKIQERQEKSCKIKRKVVLLQPEVYAECAVAWMKGK